MFSGLFCRNAWLKCKESYCIGKCDESQSGGSNSHKRKVSGRSSVGKPATSSLTSYFKIQSKIPATQPKLKLLSHQIIPDQENWCKNLWLLQRQHQRLPRNLAIYQRQQLIVGSQQSWLNTWQVNGL